MSTKNMKNYFRLMAEDRQPGWMAKALTPLLEGASVLYLGGVQIHRGLHERGILPKRKLPFPVISIGNLTWGGTGKTPLVEYLVRQILSCQKTPLVLTRGYGQDEVDQLKSHLPQVRVGVGKDRYQVGKDFAARERIDAAILDDGLQHWGIVRDLEIVTLNALNPFGNGKIFPRGMLREPRRALARADVVVLTHANLISPEALTGLRQEVARLAPKAGVAESYLEPLFFYRARKRSRVGIPVLAGKRVSTFSGVGSPRSFQLALTRLGIKPVRNFEFADHHTFSSHELEEIREVSQLSGVEEIITTEKDFHRSPESITQIMDPLVLAARIRISAGEEILSERIHRLLGGALI